MTPPGFNQQFLIFLKHGIKAELSDLERLISPILFATTVLLLFSFAFGEVDASFGLKLFIAETFLTLLMTLQLTFARLFEPEREDRAFDLIRTYPISYSAWYLGKYVVVMMVGTLTILPAIVIANLLHNPTSGASFFSWPMLSIILTSLGGLAALGVLLTAVVQKSQAKQVLYPILYFPLATPVLLAGVEAAFFYMENNAFGKTLESWGGLLLAFQIIYFTLGILLFPELVDERS